MLPAALRLVVMLLSRASPNSVRMPLEENDDGIAMLKTTFCRSSPNAVFSGGALDRLEPTLQTVLNSASDFLTVPPNVRYGSQMVISPTEARRAVSCPRLHSRYWPPRTALRRAVDRGRTAGARPIDLPDAESRPRRQQGR